MALAVPVLVSDTTNTSGTGTYALTGTTSAGYRSLANAVTAGNAANGDTCYYLVRNQSSGATLAWEEGEGTIGGAGTTLARTTIYSSSNSGAAVSWGAGGSRQVFVALGASKVGFVNAANIWTAVQTFNQRPTFAATTTTEGGEVLFKDGTSGSTDYVIDVSSSFLRFRRLGFSDITFSTSTGLVAPTGYKYDAFPTATPMYFGAAPPTGWTRVNAADDQVMKIAKSAETAGALLSASVSGLGVTVNGHTLTSAEMPVHSHTLSSHIHTLSAGVYTSTAGASTGFYKRSDLALLDGAASDTSGPDTNTSGTAGSGSSHSHTGSISSSAGTWYPRAKIIVEATKNA